MTTPSNVMVLKRHASLGCPRQLLPSAIKVLSRNSRFHSVLSESYPTVPSCFEQRIYVISLSVSNDSYYRSLLVHCEPHLQTAPPLYDATEVSDLLDDMTDREEDESCLEGSDDELGLRLSEDETIESYNNNTLAITYR